MCFSTYWRCLTMVARMGGYYGEAFKGARRVTQGDPLSPIIFNVVVDAVVQHWIDGIVDETRKREKREGRDDTSRRFSTVMTVWSSCRTLPGSRALSAPW